MALMVSYAMAQAPVYTGVPDVKLYAGKSLSSAFDLAVYNTSDAATAFSVVTGVDVATISAGAPGSISYYGLVEASSTWRAVAFEGVNEGGPGIANQVVKYSTYLVKKLGRVALAASDSDSVSLAAAVNVAGTTPSYPGTATWPASFADTNAVVADAGVTASIDTAAQTLNVSNAAALTGKKLVRIEAGPGATIDPADYDKGILQVYPNLLLNGKFDSTLSNWSTEIYGDGTGTGTVTVEASYLGKTNVYKVAQTAGQKAKATQIIDVTPNQWLTARAKVATDAASVPASKQKAYLYILDFPITRSAHDIIQPNYFAPGVWNDMEISFYARSTQVAVQLVSIIQASATAGAGMYWDNIELFAAAPAVEDAELTYGNTAVAVTNGSFDSDTSGWLYEIYGDGTGMGTISWAASQTGHSGVLSSNQATLNKGKATQNLIALGAGKSAKLSAYVLTNASAGNGGKYYAYLYSISTTTLGGINIEKSAASIIQPGSIGSSTWEEIKVGAKPSKDLSSIQIVFITGTKPAQTHYVDDVTLALDKDPIYFWDSTLFP
jgi:hypothetical protein